VGGDMRPKYDHLYAIAFSVDSDDRAITQSCGSTHS